MDGNIKNKLINFKLFLQRPGGREPCGPRAWDPSEGHPPQGPAGDRAQEQGQLDPERKGGGGPPHGGGGWRGGQRWQRQQRQQQRWSLDQTASEWVIKSSVQSTTMKPCGSHMSVVCHISANSNFIHFSSWNKILGNRRIKGNLGHFALILRKSEAFTVLF